MQGHQDVSARVTDILKSSLNGRNTFKAINTFAVPVLTYTFGVIKWSETELENILRRTRVLLTKYRALHPKSAVERLILPRCRGGRGLVDIAWLHQKQVNKLQLYFHAQNSHLHRIVAEADRRYTPLDLHYVNPGELGSDEERINNTIELWSEKQIHGRHAYDLQRPYVDEEASNAWLQNGGIFLETEGFMVAIQDQVIATKNYLKHIVKAEVETDKCRRCQLTSETIQHITGACQSLAASDYLKRHNNVAKIIHLALLKKYQINETAVPYYQYTPDPVRENETHKLYWDRSVLTDRPIVSNRPDLILVNKLQKRTFLIDIGIPNSHNMEYYYNEKVTKYLPLAAEIKDLWRQEDVIILPLIISTTGIIPKTLANNLQQLGLPLAVRNQMQKAVILDTTSTVRSFLNVHI